MASAREQAITRLSRLPDRVVPDQEYLVEPFRPEDGEAVAELVYRVYGQSYPIDDYYDPEAIRRAVVQGGLRPVVARLAGGELAGFTALYASSPPFPGLMEFGLGMVHPAYRGSFVLFHLCNALTAMMAGLDHVQAVFGEAVCDTIITQHVSSLYDFKESALELDLMPGRDAGRISCLVMTRNQSDALRPVNVPPVYADQAAWLAGIAGLQRQVAASEPGGPGEDGTRVKTQIFDCAQVMRGSVLDLGRDFPEALAQAEEKARGRGCRIFQWFLDASGNHAALAAPFLRKRSYFLSGLVPRWFDGDALLMQKNLDEPDFGEIHLYSDTARAILEMVQADRAGL